MGCLPALALPDDTSALQSHAPAFQHMILALQAGNCALQAGRSALGALPWQRPEQIVADSANQAGRSPCDSVHVVHKQSLQSS